MLASELFLMANRRQSQGYHQIAADLVWPVVQNDLAYVAQYWNQSAFGILPESVTGDKRLS